MRPKSQKQLAAIVARVEYHRSDTETWRLVVSQTNDVPYVQVHAREFRQDGVVEWSGRKWQLSRFMTTTEVINTCFKAIQSADEHELREKVLVDNQPIYSPHTSVNQLVRAWAGRKLTPDVRTDAMTGAR